MILVIGKKGQLAHSLASLDTEIVCLGRDDIDIMSYENILESLSQYSLSALINASAYTAVDKAESDYDNAHAINAMAVANLAKAAKEVGAHFVHVSTDYVFSGDKGSPYLPNDQINPINAYGKSKAEGEQFIQSEFATNSCILRTSWVYSATGNNFVKTMLMLMASKPALTVVDDQIGSPTCADTLAMACVMAANSKLTGIHHCTDEGVASWYDFAKAIQTMAMEQGLLEKAVPINPVDSSAFKTLATRPAYSVMSKLSLKESLPKLELPYWQDALSAVLKQIKQQS
ncbi:dTDP-4-dehydrorhamnose reductase [Ningiella sp. W23]|uniref:dTDP-4-dehydrorhamnose reductase n=1 Tax=Ningiella sp. W23 TaxID=3023715 RepID=UPI003757D111